MARKTGLGRGLDALLPGDNAGEADFIGPDKKKSEKQKIFAKSAGEQGVKHFQFHCIISRPTALNVGLMPTSDPSDCYMKAFTI